MAKGYEDTALYALNRLCPQRGPRPQPLRHLDRRVPPESAARLARSPHALSATATHDTKRARTVRTRIAVLSEMPTMWRRRSAGLAEAERKHRATVDSAPTPGRTPST